jgi:hypothetical protein
MIAIDDNTTALGIIICLTIITIAGLYFARGK